MCLVNSAGSGIRGLVHNSLAKGRSNAEQCGECGKEDTDDGRKNVAETVPAGPLGCWRRVITVREKQEQRRTRPHNAARQVQPARPPYGWRKSERSKGKQPRNGRQARVDPVNVTRQENCQKPRCSERHASSTESISEPQQLRAECCHSVAPVRSTGSMARVGPESWQDRAEPAFDKTGQRVWHGCQTSAAMVCWWTALLENSSTSYSIIFPHHRKSANIRQLGLVSGGDNGRSTKYSQAA